MSSELLSGLVTVAVALVGAGGVYLANRFQKGTRENKMIDQLQEQMQKMQERMDGFEARDRVYLPHILRLNMHIEQGLGPPAPPLPRILKEYLESSET